MKFALLSILLTAANLASIFAVQLVVPGYATLRGRQEQAPNSGRPFYAFRSVLYAEKPSNATRFLPPIPKAPYPEGEVVDATLNNLGCTQAQGIGMEDCLSLNVFTPTVTGGSLPVLFYIHGGAFSLGQAIEYEPARYMEKDLVVVVIQYRLGPLGFLCFDTDDVPGNAAIFDQIEALRWVRKYIDAFGGDPSKVTIVGESAGSASVSLLLLAPQAQGLFHQSVSESGSVLAEWALDSGDRGKIASYEVARLAGCPEAPYEDLLHCVRTIDAEVLTQAYFDYSANDRLNGGLGFSASNPVIQKAGVQKIIDRPPRDLLAEGSVARVPSMWGANKQEGTLVLGVIYKWYLVPNNLHNDSNYLATQAIPDILEALHIDDPTGEIAAEMQAKYMNGTEMGNFDSMVPGMTDMCSVLFLKEPTYEYAQAVSGYNNTFYYAFNYLGRHSIYNLLFPTDPPPIPHGVCHGDEMLYLWVNPFPGGSGLNASEQVLSDRMIELWSNFVIHGDPTPAGKPLLPGIPIFPPYKRTDERYMAIDETWEVRLDYTQTYTVTVDELRPKPFANKVPRI